MSIAVLVSITLINKILAGSLSIRERKNDLLFSFRNIKN